MQRGRDDLGRFEKGEGEKGWKELGGDGGIGSIVLWCKEVPLYFIIFTFLGSLSILHYELFLNSKFKMKTMYRGLYLFIPSVIQ